MKTQHGFLFMKFKKHLGKFVIITCFALGSSIYI